MKKIFRVLIVCMLFLAVKNADSQIVPTKYVKGWGTELNFNPFDGSLGLNNGSGQIKIRRFLDNNIVLRGALSIGYKTESDNEKQVYGTQPTETTDKRTAIQTVLNFGVEKHFNGGSRLSPYIGFEVGIGLKKSKQELEYNTFSKTIKGAWEVQNFYYNGQYYVSQWSYDERGFVSGNGEILTGFDFYMADNFYFGYELGFGLEYVKYSKIEVTKDADYPGSQNIPDLDSKSWKIGPRLLNGIRIGYNF